VTFLSSAAIQSFLKHQAHSAIASSKLIKRRRVHGMVKVVVARSRHEYHIAWEQLQRGGTVLALLPFFQP